MGVFAAHNNGKKFWSTTNLLGFWHPGLEKMKTEPKLFFLFQNRTETKLKLKSENRKALHWCGTGCGGTVFSQLFLYYFTLLLTHLSLSPPERMQRRQWRQRGRRRVRGWGWGRHPPLLGHIPVRLRGPGRRWALPQEGRRAPAPLQGHQDLRRRGVVDRQAQWKSKRLHFKFKFIFKFFIALLII